MTQAKPGNVSIMRAARWLLCGIGLVGSVAAGQAQTPAPLDPAALLQACETRGLDDAAKIECLRAALLSLSRSEEAVAPAMPAPPVAAPSSKPPPVAAVTGIAAEQVERIRRRENPKVEKDEKVEVASLVVDHARSASGRLVLVLENGQAWRQRDADPVQVRLKEGERARVIIRPAALTGYRLDFPDKGLIISAERVR
ncbi:hypothetical protein [Porphyrobacter sp. TH134]|uniref:hypothetical protein n=1 Tax=Porphyrobacter sp. TH134 TaxID=2067450 RepID=UPI00117CE995|nr:hypothetical protein [Porphyrobacter sp. TH134]